LADKHRTRLFPLYATLGPLLCQQRARHACAINPNSVNCCAALPNQVRLNSLSGKVNSIRNIRSVHNMGLPVLYELLQEKMKTRLLRSYGSVPEFTKRAYKLGKELGEGSVAKVLQGYSPERNELVAIKLILAEEQEKTLRFSWATKKLKGRKRSSDKNRLIPRSDILNELKVWERITDISPFTLDLFKVLNFRNQVWFVMPLSRTSNRNIKFTFP